MGIQDVMNPQVLNPLSFKDPTDRQAATLHIAQRLQDSPKFKSLPQPKQQEMLGRYYDHYVTKAYGQKAPDKDTWTKGVQERAKLGDHGFLARPDDFYNNSITDTVARVGNSAGLQVGKIMDGMTSAGIKLSMGATNAALGLHHFFGGDEKKETQVKTNVKAMLDHQKQIIGNVSHSLINSEEFWNQIHPGQTWIDSAASFSGEQLAQLPLYEAIGAARGVAVLGKGEQLTAALSKSPAGKFVINRLANATDGFFGSLASGNDTKENIQSAVSFAAFSPIIEGAANGLFKGISYASTSAIKKLSANFSSLGGRPFVQAVMDTAEKELNDYDKELAKHTVKVPDPVKDQATKAEKVAWQSLSQKMFQKPYKELKWNERQQIRKVRAGLAVDAEREMISHVPDIAMSGADKDLQRQMQKNPAFAQNVAKFEKATGMKVSTEVGQAAIKKNKEETGIINSQEVVKKIGKTKSVKPAEKNFPQAVSGAQAITKAARDTESSYSIAQKANKAAKNSIAEPLPHDLKGSKPRYNYGTKSFELNFEDPKDLAAYTVAKSNTKSKAHDKFMSYLSNYFDNPFEAIAYGQRVKAKIKELAKHGNPEDGPLEIKAAAEQLNKGKRMPLAKIRKMYKENGIEGDI